MGDGLFGDMPAIEVPLSRAPLTRVLTQVRFPSVPEIALGDGQHRLSSLLRKTYPIVRQKTGVNFLITPSGVMQQEGQAGVWQLHDRESVWQVSFSDGFVSLETSKYTSRDDFCTRLKEVLEALAVVGEPVLCDRIGIRYINQITGSPLQDIGRFLSPHLVAGWTLSRSTEKATLIQSVNEALFIEESEKMLVRSAWIPPGGMVEPTIPVLDELSCALDLDAFTDKSEDYSPEDVSVRVRDLADAAYRAFRALVTEDFLEHYS
ncbi:TIGR04255 family protein [Streptomyces sp. JL2001]|uniref:TIGR04255 family protein n=1 Tax=Streptomyces sp. JL2001 TaxID=3342488 RepID=UPI003D80099D